MSLLRTILAHKNEEIAACKKAGSLDRLRDKPNARPRDFLSALRKPGMSFIAEIKRKSPSGGVLREHLEPAAIGRSYEQHGAVAVSVVTDYEFFGGAPEEIAEVKAAVSVPVLRKEFIIDAFQIHESFLIGADAVLLIVGILSAEQLREYLALTAELKLSAIVEVHSEKELEWAVEARAKIIGINNRNLDTLQVDLGTAPRLRKLLPGECVAVAESGIHTPEDAMRMHEADFDALLVGESLISADNPGRKLTELVEAVS